MDRPVRNPNLIGLGIDLIIQMDKSLTPLGEGVYHGHAHTVKATGNLVGFFVKLAPGVEPGHNQFQGADPFIGMNINRNTPAIILHPDNIVSLQDNKNLTAEALHRLVNRIIDHLKNQMVKAVYARGPDIHTGAFAYRLQILENGDIFSGIVRIHCSMIAKMGENGNMGEGEKKTTEGTEFTEGRTQRYGKSLKNLLIII
jgi:hypothetical protein